jgi:hypothetical protein
MLLELGLVLLACYVLMLREEAEADLQETQELQVAGIPEIMLFWQALLIMEIQELQETRELQEQVVLEEDLQLRTSVPVPVPQLSDITLPSEVRVHPLQVVPQEEQALQGLVMLDKAVLQVTQDFLAIQDRSMLL